MAYNADQTISPLPLVQGYGKRKLTLILNIKSFKSQPVKYILQSIFPRSHAPAWERKA